jgi:hypothetical protein
MRQERLRPLDRGDKTRRLRRGRAVARRVLDRAGWRYARPIVRLLSLALLVVSCGGSTAAQPDPSTPPAPVAAADPSAVADPSASASAAASAAAPPSYSALPVPTACADKSADVCTPSSSFVERLCNRPHQDTALALFASGTPFSRMYLRGKLDELAWDEEVLALRFHGVPKGGIQVGSAAGSYDVLRWDGTCSMAVDAEMLTKARPSRPKTAHLQWHRLADKTQTSLIAASAAVKKAYKRRGSECQGAMTGDVSASCEKADEALIDAVVSYVRGGGSVPAPDAL